MLFSKKSLVAPYKKQKVFRYVDKIHKKFKIFLLNSNPYSVFLLIYSISGKLGEKFYLILCVRCSYDVLGGLTHNPSKWQRNRIKLLQTNVS